MHVFVGGYKFCKTYVSIIMLCKQNYIFFVFYNSKISTLSGDIWYFFQDDIRRVKRDLEKSGAEKGDMTSKIEELNLYNDSSEKELRKIIRNKQVRIKLVKGRQLKNKIFRIHVLFSMNMTHIYAIFSSIDYWTQIHEKLNELQNVMHR